MTRLLILCLMAVTAAVPGLAADATADAEAIRPAGDTELSEFKWVSRPIVVFADSPEDARFAEQMEKLTDGLEQLLERDVVILTDTDPAAASPLRQKLRPRGFVLVLVGKDGGIKFRKPLPWTVREITRSIDKMPMRQREIRERRVEG